MQALTLKGIASHIKETPVTVIVRGIMEIIFEPTALNELFETYAVKQYTRELLNFLPQLNSSDYF
ncbi:hypothetical protein C7B62_10415 [Pleurocapsa sp. CCALA 161]|nr:hypothetical protein C7B62_10415 [Pleurocapsa sp. CCALA 161]